jgi:hypothetical protein
MASYDMCFAFVEEILVGPMSCRGVCNSCRIAAKGRVRGAVTCRMDPRVEWWWRDSNLNAAPCKPPRQKYRWRS